MFLPEHLNCRAYPSGINKQKRRLFPPTSHQIYGDRPRDSFGSPSTLLARPSAKRPLSPAGREGTEFLDGYQIELCAGDKEAPGAEAVALEYPGAQGSSNTRVS